MENMDLIKIGNAVKNGLSVVCATCRRYWEGRDRKLPEPKCTAARPCGSPFAGMTFPEYKGPINDFTRWCFVCGGKPKYGVKVRNGRRALALCENHIHMLGETTPVDLKINGNIVDVHDKKWLSQKQFFGPPVKTLGQAIAETEAEFAAEAEEKARR